MTHLVLAIVGLVLLTSTSLAQQSQKPDLQIIASVSSKETENAELSVRLLNRSDQESDPCCSIVVQALRDYGHLKVGMKRSEVEKDFQHSGGLSTRTEANYVYKECQIISVQIKFSPSPTSKDESPDDVVSSFSQLVVKEQPAD
jgi:hypothetical protein